MQLVVWMIKSSNLEFFLCVFLQETDIAPDCNHVSIPSKTPTKHFFHLHLKERQIFLFYLKIKEELSKSANDYWD